MESGRTMILCYLFLFLPQNNSFHVFSTVLNSYEYMFWLLKKISIFIYIASYNFQTFLRLQSYNVYSSAIAFNGINFHEGKVKVLFFLVFWLEMKGNCLVENCCVCPLHNPSKKACVQYPRIH